MTWTNALIDVLLFFFVIDCLLMILVVLMQRSKQEGLGAAFGGGFTESVWGAQTSNVLVKTTVVLAAVFFCVSILLARLYSVRASHMEKPSSLQEQLLKPIAPLTSTHATPALVTPAPMTATNSSGTSVVPTATPMTPAAPATNAVPAAK